MHNNINVNVSGPVQPASTYKTKVLKGNQPFALQVTEPNTKYVIKHNFDLGDKSITIPEGCLIEFDGGCISNGTLVGQNTILIFEQEEEVVLKNVTLLGEFTYPSANAANKKDNTNGMAKVYLKKNKSFASQLTQQNTIYVIQYDFDLGDESVTIPENSILEFDGGSLRNGTLVGNGTQINWNRHSVIFSDINISGDWILDYISTAMFADLSADNALRNLQYLNNDTTQNTVVIEEGEYWFAMASEGDHGFLIHSNTHFIINGTCKMRPNAFEAYNMIWSRNRTNIIIDGSGSLVGDKDSHLGETGEKGQNLTISRCNNVIVRGITSTKAWGDCINVSAGQASPYVSNSKIIIENVNISYGRRQGISVTSGNEIIIRNSVISNCGGTAPGAAIDIEPNSYDEPMFNVVINNIFAKDCVQGILVNGAQTAVGIHNAEVSNCFVENCGGISILGRNCKAFKASVNYIKNPIYIYFRAHNCDVATFDNNCVDCDETHAPMCNCTKNNFLYFTNNRVKYEYPANADFPDDIEGHTDGYISTAFVNDRNQNLLFKGNHISYPKYMFYNFDKLVDEDAIPFVTKIEDNVLYVRGKDLFYSTSAKDAILANNVIKFDFNYKSITTGAFELYDNIQFINNIINIENYSRTRITTPFKMNGNNIHLEENVISLNRADGDLPEDLNVAVFQFANSSSECYVIGNTFKGNMKYLVSPANDASKSVFIENRLIGSVKSICTSVGSFTNLRQRIDAIKTIGGTSGIPILDSTITGFQYFNTDLGKPIYWNGEYWADSVNNRLTWKLSYYLTNATASNEARPIVDQPYTTIITADDGYSLPATITVKMGGTTQHVGTDYTYNQSTGELVILGTGGSGGVTGGLTIIVNAEANS